MSDRITTPERQCIGCSEVKPLTLQHFSYRTHRGKPRNTCRVCDRLRARKSYVAAAREPIERPTERKCDDCHETKPFTREFWEPTLMARCRLCNNVHRRIMRRGVTAKEAAQPYVAPARAAKAICSECCNITDRRPRPGLCRCGLPWEAEPRPELMLRRSV